MSQHHLHHPYHANHRRRHCRVAVLAWVGTCFLHGQAGSGCLPVFPSVRTRRAPSSLGLRLPRPTFSHNVFANPSIHQLTTSCMTVYYDTTLPVTIIPPSATFSSYSAISYVTDNTNSQAASILLFSPIHIYVQATCALVLRCVYRIAEVPSIRFITDMYSSSCMCNHMVLTLAAQLLRRV